MIEFSAWIRNSSTPPRQGGYQSIKLQYYSYYPRKCEVANSFKDQFDIPNFHFVNVMAKNRYLCKSHKSGYACNILLG